MQTYYWSSCFRENIQAKTVEIGQKPKRGRPAATKKALQRQDIPVVQLPTVLMLASTSIATSSTTAFASEVSTLSINQPVAIEATAIVQKRKKGRPPNVKIIPCQSQPAVVAQIQAEAPIKILNPPVRESKRRRI